MIRPSRFVLTTAAAGALLLSGLVRPRAASAPVVPATRYYPIQIGNKWDFAFKRSSILSMARSTGESRDLTTASEGTQSVEIVREDAERSGENGKVYVQRSTENARTTVGSGGEKQEAGEAKQRLVSESYFRVNDRGIWLIADGEPDDKGEAVEKVTDRRKPLLWSPPDLKPDKSWVITCQIDSNVTARLSSVAGPAQKLKIGGETYENCIPVVSIADKLQGRLDLGVGMAPIKDGRIVDVTWYAPKIGVVKTHQSATFELVPPNAMFSTTVSHYEETQELQPGYKARE